MEPEPIGRCRECFILLYDMEDVYICAAIHQSGTDTVLGPTDSPTNEPGSEVDGVA